MSFIHSNTFAYVKNLVIGVGASVVLIGALFKIMSWPGANEMLQVGLYTEAGLFLMLGLLPPHKEYYWEKLYPGLDHHGGRIEHPGSNGSSEGSTPLDGAALTRGLDKIGDSLGSLTLDTSTLEGQQEKMVKELQTMAKSMSSLQSLQETDFTEVERLTKGAGKFATALGEAITSISESLEDTKIYREQLGELNTNLKKLNGVYSDALQGDEMQTLKKEANRFAGELGSAMGSISDTLQDTNKYRKHLNDLNSTMSTLNQVYGNVLAAMGGKKG